MFSLFFENELQSISKLFRHGQVDYTKISMKVWLSLVYSDANVRKGVPPHIETNQMQAI